MSSPAISRSKAPLLGFRAPSAHTREENPRLRRLPGRAPRVMNPGICRQVPPCRLRCRSQVFSTSQRLLPLPPAPPFSDGFRSWGLPYRGLILPRSPGYSSPPVSPHDVAPAGCATSVLGGGCRGRTGCYLGWLSQRLSRLQGLRPRGNRSASSTLIKDSTTDLPLLGFRLLMVCTRASRQGFRPATVVLHEQWVRRQTRHPLHSTACCSPGPTLSRESAVPSRGSSPATASSV